MMKKLSLLLLFSGWMLQGVFSQNYVSFPTDTAHWNCLFWHQWEPSFYLLTNYQYQQQGDTVLKGKSYKKIYTKLLDTPSTYQYLGGLREDTEKQLFFFPADIHCGPPVSNHIFPHDTAEQLLYTFNNLSVGMNLPIISGNNTFHVAAIDSVLVGNKYRKRYEIHGSCMFGPEYWIEGIGSTKDLLAPFTYEFEWTYYTLCYADTTTYYINGPYGSQTCQYLIHINVKDNEPDKIMVSPNPATDFIYIKTPSVNTTFEAIIFNIQGQVLLRKGITASTAELDIRQLESGIYYLQLIIGNAKTMKRFIKL